MNNFLFNLLFNGLGNISLTIPSAGEVSFNVQSSIPTLSQGSTANSALVIVIKQNGSTVYTGTAGSTGAQTSFVCAAADVIQFVFSSSAAVDQPLNAIKSVISVSSGQGV